MLHQYSEWGRGGAQSLAGVIDMGRGGIAIENLKAGLWPRRNAGLSSVNRARITQGSHMNLPQCKGAKTHKEIVRIMVFSIQYCQDGQATSNTKARAPLPGFSRVIWDEWGKKGVRMDTKALKKQMGAAIAMVLVAAVALGSATFAWFVSNNTVKATTSKISAQSNAPFLKIDKTAITAGSTTSISYADEADVKLYPAQVVKNTDNKPLFKSAYASAATATTELTNSRYDVGDAATAVTGEFAIKKSFKIGTADAKAGSFKNLKVAGVELTSKGTDGLEDALSILVVCGDNWAVYKKSADGTVLTAYKDGVSVAGNNTDGVLADTIAANSSVDVDVYVFYDGSETNVYTNNLDKLTAIGATVSFTATPVNTQNQEVNAPNESK